MLPGKMYICRVSNIPPNSVFCNDDFIDFETPFISKDKNFIFCNLDEALKLNSKFVFYIKIDLWLLSLSNYNDHEKTVDFLYNLNKVVNAVNENNCMVFLNASTRPFLPFVEKNSVFALYHLLKKIGIKNFNNIHILTGTHFSKNEKCIMKYIFWEYFESLMKFTDTTEVNFDVKIKNLENVAYSKRFLYLNNRERTHRIYLFCKLHTLINNFYDLFAASMCPEQPIFKNKSLDFSVFKKRILPFKTGTCPAWVTESNDVESFLHEYNKLVSSDDGTIKTSIAEWKNRGKQREIYYENCHDTKIWERIGIYIGTETAYTYNEKRDFMSTSFLSLTEKTYKPIRMKTPFILYGQPFILKQLKNDGYQTFGDLWDESYDSVLEPAARADKIADVIAGIAKLSNNDFIELISNTREIIEHNYNNMMNRFPEQKIYEHILNFYNESC